MAQRTKTQAEWDKSITLGDTEIDGATKEIIDLAAKDAVADIEPFTITKLGFNEPPQEDKATFASMERKYKTLVSEMTIEEQLELAGISLKKAFPPLDRDVEKLIIDINVVMYKYMQLKMEQNPDLLVETIQSTVQEALGKVLASLTVNGK